MLADASSARRRCARADNVDAQNDDASINVVDFAQLRQTINNSYMDAKWKAAYLKDLCSIYRFAEARLSVPTMDPRIVNRMQALQKDAKRDARRAEGTTQTVAGAERMKRIPLTERVPTQGRTKRTMRQAGASATCALLL